MERKKRNMDKFKIIHSNVNVIVNSTTNPSGFIIKFINKEKGRGVFATRRFSKGDVLFDYRGKVVRKEPTDLTYVFQFKYKGNLTWIDASEDDGSLGRLVNDSMTNPNAIGKLYDLDGPHILFFASSDIKPGKEICFNYDGLKKETFDWRKQVVAAETEQVQETLSESEIVSSGSEWVPGKDEDENSSESSTDHLDAISTTTSNNRMAGIEKLVEDCNKHHEFIIPPSERSPVKKRPLISSCRQVKRRCTETNIKQRNEKEKSSTKRQCHVNENDSESSTEHPDVISTETSNYRMARIDKWLEDIDKYKVSVIDNTSNISPLERSPVKRRPLSSSCRQVKRRCIDKNIKQKHEKENGSAKRQCHVCGKTLQNLQRHLKEQHGELNEKGQRAVSSRGYIVRYCPLCDKQYDRLRDHLSRKHQIKDKVLLRSLQDDAEPVPTEKYKPRLKIPQVTEPSFEEKIETQNDEANYDTDYYYGTESDLIQQVKALPLDTPKTLKDVSNHEKDCDIEKAPTSTHPVKRKSLDNPKTLKDVSKHERGFDIAIASTTTHPVKGKSLDNPKTLKDVSKHKKDCDIEIAPTSTHPVKGKPLDNPKTLKDVSNHEKDCDIEKVPTSTHPVKRKSLDNPVKNVIVTKKTKIMEESYKDDETLQMFKKWLTSSTCQKKEREANQHCSQVFRIWNTVTTENRRTLHDITDSKKIERLWYAKERNKPAGTLRSYISSCALFIDFLLVNGASKKMSPRCVSCKTYLKTLSKSLNKQANRRKIEMMTKDIQTMVYKDDIVKFLNSETATETVKTLMKDDWEVGGLTSTQFANARDFVILKILLRNGQRPGAILGITHRTLRTALRTPDGVTITMKEHKTGDISPANIGIDCQLYDLIVKYINLCKFVPNYMEDEDESIFITWPRHNEVPGRLEKLRGMQHLWEKENPKKLTATKLRKSVSTSIRESHPELREKLADHMNHLATTADKYYVMKSTRDKALEMSNVIHQQMTGQVEKTMVKETYRYQINLEMYGRRMFPEYKVTWPKSISEECNAIFTAVPCSPIQMKPNPSQLVEVCEIKSENSLIELTSDDGINVLKQEDISVELSEENMPFTSTPTTESNKHNMSEECNGRQTAVPFSPIHRNPELHDHDYVMSNPRQLEEADGIKSEDSLFQLTSDDVCNVLKQEDISVELSEENMPFTSTPTTESNKHNMSEDCNGRQTAVPCSSIHIKPELPDNDYVKSNPRQLEEADEIKSEDSLVQLTSDDVLLQYSKMLFYMNRMKTCLKR